MTRLFAFLVLALACLGLVSFTRKAPAVQDYEAEWHPPGHLKELRYAVTRDGRPIGYHLIRFLRRSSRYEVISRTRVEVKTAFITLYRFNYDGREVWEDGELQSFSARTERNGQISRIDAKIAEDFQWIKKESGGPEDLSPDDLTSGHIWAEWQLSRSFYIDPMDGRLVPIRATLLGKQDLKLGEQRLGARRYFVAGANPRILWFGPNHLLIKMQFRTDAGSILELRLMTHTEDGLRPGLAAIAP